MKKINVDRQYLLFWGNNPSYWNDDLEELKKKRIVQKINGRYYTIVQPHMSGKFSIVDCTCNERTGDFYPINTSLLKEINE
jgi:hypothetical protein